MLHVLIWTMLRYNLNWLDCALFMLMFVYISYRTLFVLRITIYVIAKIWILFLDDLYLFCLLEYCIPAPAPSFPPLHRKIITCRNRFIADIWLTCMCDLDFKLFSSSRSNLEYVTVLLTIRHHKDRSSIMQHDSRIQGCIQKTRALPLSF